MTIKTMLNVFVRNGNDPQLKEAMKQLRASRYKNICIWIQHDLINEAPYRNWRDKHIIDDKVGAMMNLYFEWDLANNSANHLDYSMRCLWWHWICESQDFCVMQNPLPIKDQVVMFEDARNDKALPNKFYKAFCFNTYDSLINYCRSKGVVKFSLHDETQFRHEHDIPMPKGAEVYRELATERLWYKDTMHKNHYEVYDRFGKKHIGEADLNGFVDYSKADSSKHAIR